MNRLRFVQSYGTSVITISVAMAFVVAICFGMI